MYGIQDNERKMREYELNYTEFCLEGDRIVHLFRVPWTHQVSSFLQGLFQGSVSFAKHGQSTIVANSFVPVRRFSRAERSTRSLFLLGNRRRSRRIPPREISENLILLPSDGWNSYHPVDNEKRIFDFLFFFLFSNDKQTCFRNFEKDLWFLKFQWIKILLPYK